MTVQALFPTLIYTATVRSGDLNERLLRECRQLRIDDEAGQRWSGENYPGGYTSYGSVCQMQRVSPTFAELERELDKHVASFVRELDFDMKGRKLVMTDCWVNIMEELVVHGMHLHPLSTISGTYYVLTPKGTSGLKFEDPRLDRFMASPPRGSRSRSRPWYTLAAQAGRLVLFESWLRHEVPPNRVAAERISISFNYNWFG
jgi:uncharacterized protein (TIGR02466 family)